MAGSVVNYYDLLQVHPQAEFETIHRVYKLFAARYHPDNLQTGDAERFRLITEAHRVLTDPTLRLAHDARLGDTAPKAIPIFQSRDFTNGLEAEANIRVGILCLLYAKRRANPDYAALSVLDLEQLMAFPREHLQFGIWYLKSKRLVQQDDRSSFHITFEGVDFLENQIPNNELLRKVFQASETGVMVYPKALLMNKKS